MDAFGADNDTAALRGQRVAINLFEMRNCLQSVVFDACAAPAGDHSVRARTLQERIEQDHLQVATVDRELRHVVAGKTTSRLAVNELAEAIVEAILACGDGDLGKRILEPERKQ